MLSRIAGNCLWMARYLERAENNARLAEVAQAQSLLPESVNEPRAAWEAALQVGADAGAYRALHGEISPEGVRQFLVIDRENPSSVVSCLRFVRENARSARHLLTEAHFEAINATWLEVQSWDSGRLLLPEELLDDVRARVHRIRGASAELPEDGLPWVLRAGEAMERIDFTVRLLEIRLPELLAASGSPANPGSPAHRRWELLLRAGAVVDVYRRLCGPSGDLRKALELLLLRADEPRSVLCNLLRLEKAVARFTGRSDTRTGSIAAAARARIEAVGPLLPGGDLPVLCDALSAEMAKVHEALISDHCS